MARCPLCLEDKEIVSSHLIPQAMYDYCRTGDSEPVVMTSRIVMQTSRQVQTPLLCLDCEDVLNKGGENWLLPLLTTIDKKFRLLDIIERFEADVVDGELRIYAASRNPAIESDKLIHFAMGVFWKASIHSWRGDSKELQIDLGPYRESVRAFLLQAPFRARVAYFRKQIASAQSAKLPVTFAPMRSWKPRRRTATRPSAT